MMNVFEVQKKLVSLALPSGHEWPQRDYIADIVRPLCDEVYTDTLGNLICHKKGSGKKLMMPAHMDVIGFMVTFITDDGRIVFAPLGGHAYSALENTPVRFENGVHGVMMKDEGARDDALGKLKNENFYISLGLKNGDEVRKHVSIGDVAVFASDPVEIENGCIMGPYADNLSSCAALLIAMEQVKDSPNDLYFVFTVQEEVGLRGAGVAARNLSPDACIAIDVCTTGDNPATKDLSAVSVGNGPTVKIRDSSLLCNPQMIEFLRGAADEAEIKYQNEILLAGGTDSGAVQRVHGGVITGAISIPTRNIHSPNEVFSISDAENAGRLLARAAMKELVF